MKRISVVFIFLFAFSAAVLGQNFAFKVLANKGNNQYRSGNGSWQALKTGASLKSNDQLKVSSQAYLGLMHASGKTLEVRDEGTYKVSVLETQVSKGDNSVITKYADFVQRKMSEEERASTRNRLAATGAVERGLSDINVFLPKSADFYGDKAWVGWENKGEGKTYSVKVKNWFDEVILEKVTEENYVELDFNDPKLKDQRLLVVNVSLKGEDVKSPDYGVRRVAKDEVSKIEGEYSELNSGLNEDSPLDKLILAEFFEQKGVLVDAGSKYLEAIQKSPDVEYFKEAYAEFLMRNNLVEEVIEEDPLEKK